MKIYVGLIERGCVTDEYIENIYVGTNKKIAEQKVNEVKECNYRQIEVWEKGERIEVIDIK